MSTVQLDAYLFFKEGKCKEAMEFYKGVFGGEVTMQTYGEVPADMPMGDANPDWVMHATLKGGAVTFMASDSTTSDSFGKSAISLSLGGEDETQLREMFDKLAQGGNVDMPLEKVFWGDIFGSVTDKYGIEWMVNIGSTEPDNAEVKGAS